MISIRQSLSELEKAHQLQQAIVETFRGSILSVAQYAVDVDAQLTPPHKAHLTAIAETLRPDVFDPVYYEEVRASLRNELRDYRDRAAKCLNDLHQEIAAKAASLTQIFEAMAACDGDHETRIAKSISTLREIAADPRAAPVRQALSAAADSLVHSMEELQKQNQITIAQFQVEVRMLHNRIEALQTAAAVDSSTQLSSRSQIEVNIGCAVSSAAGFAVLLLKARNLRTLQRQFGDRVAESAISAFAKRLRNCLRPDDPAGRWGEDQFVVLLGETKGCRALARRVAEHTSGVYVCMEAGKPVRPLLQIDVGVVETGPGEMLDHVVRRIEEFFKV